MAAYRLSPRARDGLTGLLDRAERNFGRRVAERVLHRLADAFTSLARHPHLRRRRPEITDDPDIRFLAVTPTLIAYSWSEEGGLVVLLVERDERD